MHREQGRQGTSYDNCCVELFGVVAFVSSFVACVVLAGLPWAALVICNDLDSCDTVA